MPTVLSQYRVVIDAMLATNLATMLGDDPLESPVADAMGRIADPEFETCMIDADGTVHDRRTGVEGWLAAWKGWVQAFDRFFLEETREPTVRGNALVNFVVQRARLPDSDVEVIAEGTGVWFFENERLRRLELHLDRDRAMRAAGAGS
ncbi:MAG: hypothetical protein QOE06_1383 [Thermoleophilaceae bacterium]|jgi:hypothetical protein|nr:hypothetical protein [Thermoleophilaceae bacterium]